MGIEYVHQPLLADAANADSGADRDAAPGAADSLRRGSDASADADAAAADAAASSSDMVDGAKATLAFARSCYICKSRCRRRRRRRLLVAASWPPRGRLVVAVASATALRASASVGGQTADSGQGCLSGGTEPTFLPQYVWPPALNAGG
jgi:hypothetical protein